MQSLENLANTSSDWLRAVWGKWKGAAFWVAIVIGAFAIALWCARYFIRWVTTNPVETEKVVAAAIVIVFSAFCLVLVVTFFWVFRGIKADAEQLDRIITYCYAFIVFSLFASVLPFFALPMIPQLYVSMTKSPVGIIAGCSLPSNATTPAPAGDGGKSAAAKDDTKGGGARSVPKELRCDGNMDQWVVNIGGTVASEEPGKMGFNLVRISGGLVIPLYVIVLALMGAAVSMTRRVPEYQRRISPGDAEYLTYDQAREGLVFQIMQVASAPLIAVTAYYLIDPESRANTIVLSFASGFSSETVLLLIRAFLEKFKPLAANLATKVAAVAVAPLRLDFGSVKAPGSARKSVSITNPGPAMLIISNLGCTGEYAAATVAPVNVAPHSSGVVEIEFKPTSAGAKQGQLTITDNATGSPRTVELTGTGI